MITSESLPHLACLSGDGSVSISSLVDEQQTQTRSTSTSVLIRFFSLSIVSWNAFLLSLRPSAMIFCTVLVLNGETSEGQGLFGNFES